MNSVSDRAMKYLDFPIQSNRRRRGEKSSMPIVAPYF